MNTRFLVVVAIFVFCQEMMAQQKLTVLITHIKNDEGEVAVALYNSEKEFMQNPFQGKKVKATKGELEVVFEDIPSGSYGLSVMHDANLNGKLDYRSVGIPKEGFGFSNNPTGKVGIPLFEKVKVEVPAAQKIQITMRYIEPARKKQAVH